MRLADFADGKSDVFKIDPRKLRVESGFNSRDFTAQENIDHVLWLKENIKAVGLKEALTVRLDGDIGYIVGGECRWRAIMMLIDEGEAWESVPCLPDARNISVEERLADQPIRNHGKQFTQLELAALARKLIGYGWAESKIAAYWGMTHQNLSRILELNQLPEAVKQTVRAGEIAPSTAAAVIREEGPIAGAETISTSVEIAKAAGKTKATPKQITVARSQGSYATPKPVGKTLKPHVTEKVLAFLRNVLTADNLDDVKQEAERTIDLVLGA